MKIAVFAMIPFTVILVLTAHSQLSAQKREVAMLKQEALRQERRSLDRENELSRAEAQLKRATRDLEAEKAATRLCLHECFVTE